MSHVKGAVLGRRLHQSRQPARRTEWNPHVSDLVAIVVYVPFSHADAVRVALAKGGAGAIGEYTVCSFSATGEGRFLPGASAHPTIGQPGVPQVVDEVRVEVVCPKATARVAVQAMLDAHPYEEPAWHAYDILLLPDLP